MSNFGLQVTNDSGVLQIDDTTPIMVYLFRGTLSITSRGSTGAGTVTFPQPVASINPPQVFLRVTSVTGGNISAMYIIMRGDPGNWTGFTLITPVGRQTDHLEWVICVESTEVSKGGYGLEVYGEDGTVNFNSELMPVFVSKVTTSWNYRYYQNKERALISTIQPDADDFVSITSLNAGYEYFGDTAYTSLSLWDYGPFLSIYVNTYFHNEGPEREYTVNIGIPICKFPIDKYL